MNSNRTRRITWAVLPIVLAAPMALADTLMVTREGSRSADATTTVQLWSGANRVARIDGNSRMIGDLDAGMLYVIDDDARTCHAMSIRDPERDPAVLQAAVAAVELRNTGRSERIGPWQADVYELVAAGDEDGYEMLVWITAEFDVDQVQRDYMESVATPETAAMLAIYNLGGFPVRSEMRMGPIEMWSELESIEEKPAPAGTYAVPRGYTGCN